MGKQLLERFSRYVIIMAHLNLMFSSDLVFTIGFVQVFFALTITAVGVSQSSALAPDTNKAKDSAASIFEILDSKPAIDSSSDEGTTLDTVKGEIELQQVSFCYPTRPNIQIFKDMCLTMPTGKVISNHFQ